MGQMTMRRVGIIVMESTHIIQILMIGIKSLMSQKILQQALILLHFIKTGIVFIFFNEMSELLEFDLKSNRMTILYHGNQEINSYPGLVLIGNIIHIVG